MAPLQGGLGQAPGGEPSVESATEDVGRENLYQPVTAALQVQLVQHDLGHAHEALVVHAAVVSQARSPASGRKREELSQLSNSRAGVVGPWELCRDWGQMGLREAELRLTSGNNLLSTRCYDIISIYGMHHGVQTSYIFSPLLQLSR